MVLKRLRRGKNTVAWFRRRWNYMVLKRFVKSLDFRLQCWVWKKIKLHGTQTIQFHLYVTHSIWRGVKLQGSQTCYCAAKTKKLQGTQTFTGWSLRQQRVWQKIKLHDSQTFSLLFPLWRRAKLHGSQINQWTSCAQWSFGRRVKLHGTQTNKSAYLRKMAV